MLRPQDGPTRERKSLNGLWRFRLDPAGEGRDAAWWRRPLADARDMPVPASYNDIPADAAVRDHVGERPPPPGRAPALPGRIEAEAPQPVQGLALAGGTVLGAQHGCQ